MAEDSPAQEAGLQENDIITEVNGTVITGSSDLVNLVGDAQIGDVLQMKVYRQGNMIDVAVTIGEKVQAAIEESAQSDAQQIPQGFPFPFGN